MNKIKILQVISELGDGGVESMLMDIYRNIDKEKFCFIFVASSDNNRYTQEISDYGGKVIIVEPLKEIGVFKYTHRLIKICKIEGIDVVHCHNLTQNPIILLAALLSGIKIRVSHSHLTACFSRKAKILMPFIRFSINVLATHKLACGNEAGKFLYGNKKFNIINNAIDIDKFYNARKLNEINGIDIKNKYVILHVGRLSEQKNHNFIVKIMSKLDKDIVLFCCGTGPLEKDIKNLIINNNLENNMVLLGSRNDIPNLMKTANLMILPSLYEGLPVSLIEAQASGLKSISSNTIDKDCDLGLGLVDFLPINDNNEEIWIKKITSYKNNGYVIPNNIKEKIIEKGYSSKRNCELISSIYALEK